MNAYQVLEAMLKVATENTKVLHRNLTGAEWFPTHEQLATYYEKLDEITDDIVEIGLSQDIPEVTIAEALTVYKGITAEPRKARDILKAVKGFLDDIAAQMELIANEVEEAWIADKLRMYEE